MIPPSDLCAPCGRSRPLITAETARFYHNLLGLLYLLSSDLGNYLDLSQLSCARVGVTEGKDQLSMVKTT